VWRGAVRVFIGGETLEEISGFCVGGAGFVPEPESAENRVVERWQAGLFELVSLLEYPPESAVSSRMNFLNALAELGIEVPGTSRFR